MYIFNYSLLLRLCFCSAFLFVLFVFVINSKLFSGSELGRLCAKLHIDYKTGGHNLSSALRALTSPAGPRSSLVNTRAQVDGKYFVVSSPEERDIESKHDKLTRKHDRRKTTQGF